MNKMFKLLVCTSKHLTGGCCSGFGGLPLCNGAENPAIRTTLRDRNKQCPVPFAGEIPLASISSIRAAIDLIVLKRKYNMKSVSDLKTKTI